MNKVTVIVIGVVILGTGLLFAFNSGSDENVPQLPQLQQTQEDQNEVVAVVNGENVLRSELSAQTQQLAQSQQLQIPPGEEAQIQTQLEQLALEQIIGTRLILEDAINQGFSIDDTQIETELSILQEQAGGEAAFQDRLSQAGVTKDAVREEIRRQLVLDAYFSQVATENNITASQEEIQTFYDEQVAVLEDAPAIEEVEEQIAASIKEEKLQPVLASLVEELLQDADVEVLL